MRRRNFIKTASGIFIPAIVGMAQVVDPYRFAAAPSYLLSSPMESNTGWTENVAAGGTLTWNSNEQTIEGTGSLKIEATTGTSIHATSPTFTAQSELWAFIALYLTGAAADATNDIFAFRTASASPAFVRLSSTSGRFVIQHGATSANVNSTAVTGWQYIWLRFVKSVSSDGILDFYHSTTQTKPGSPNASITTGSSTAEPDRVRCLSISGAQSPLYFDKLRVSTSSIGSNPT